jgi:NAD(P)H-hydrate epimerase
MIEDYHISLIQMMENAGRDLAHLARERFLCGDPRRRKVIVLAGTGGSGGGALVAARRLHNYGANIRVFVTKPDADFAPVPAHQLDILRRMNVPVNLSEEINSAGSADLVIDGIIGYSLHGNPRGTAAALIQWANTQNAPILALDAPSGLDTTTGTVYKPAIQAAATMTLALPKAGLLSGQGLRQVGELYLADISVPPELFAIPTLNIPVGPIFAASDIVRLRQSRVPLEEEKTLQPTAEYRRLIAHRLQETEWKRSGPHLSERARGTVREDHSPNGSAWDYFPHDANLLQPAAAL